MTDASNRWQELDSLLDLLLDGLHTEADSHRLNDILRYDEEACGHYIGYVHLHGRLLWGEGRQKVARTEGSGIRGQVSETTLPLSLASGRGVGGEGDLQQSTFSNSPQPTLFHEQGGELERLFPVPCFHYPRRFLSPLLSTLSSLHRPSVPFFKSLRPACHRTGHARCVVFTRLTFQIHLPAMNGQWHFPAKRRKQITWSSSAT